MKNRTVALFAIIAVVMAMVPVTALLISRSTVATPAEISATVTATPPVCRELVRSRIATRIAASGAISRRQLEMLSHADCNVAGPQYSAATGH